MTPNAVFTDLLTLIKYALFTALFTSATNAIAETFVIVFVGDTDSAGYRGAKQGFKEANAQGRFLGHTFDLIHAVAPRDLPEQDVVAIVADQTPLRLLQITERAAGTAVLNVSAEDDELREECRENLLHTIPSRAMRDDAIQQWLRKVPGSPASAQAWHKDFKKYAAAQLNKRYTESFSEPMNDVAWAAWAAVKMVSDLAVRGDASEPSAMLDSLKENLEFDGQKGAAMSFRPTGQLRQPMLLVNDGKLVGEAPVRGVVAITNLDSLGMAECPK
ncbi:MAG: hypothetical protein AAF384_18065 [Pseudomonadota bacterium]